MGMQMQPFFTAQGNLLADGRLSNLVRGYNVPLTVYLTGTGRWHVLRSRHAILEAFWSKYRGIAAAGVGRLRACVTAQSMTGRDRFAVDVTWFYVSADGRRLGRTSARYFMERRPEGIRVDMIEFQEIAFPQINDWFADHAQVLSAGASLRL